MRCHREGGGCHNLCHALSSVIHMLPFYVCLLFTDACHDEVAPASVYSLCSSVTTVMQCSLCRCFATIICLSGPVNSTGMQVLFFLNSDLCDVTTGVMCCSYIECISRRIQTVIDYVMLLLCTSKFNMRRTLDILINHFVSCFLF